MGSSFWKETQSNRTATPAICLPGGVGERARPQPLCGTLRSTGGNCHTLGLDPSHVRGGPGIAEQVHHFDDHRANRASLLPEPAVEYLFQQRWSPRASLSTAGTASQISICASLF
jgi:hypothetical protein